ncbi:unnamed protein product, partial [Mesorhabditis spiculigera]
MDDVVGWMLETSKRLGVPCEDINMSKFATLTGSQLLKMNENDFTECDPNYGKLFYREMARLLNVTIPEDNILDDVLRKYKDFEETKPSPMDTTMQLQQQLQRQHEMNSLFAAQQQLTQTLANNIRQQLTNNLCAALNPTGLNLNNLASSPLLHAKGNKLWEFIRDALKDPATCPSVVRWEDPNEGVFRIVESEKLARLWGERKNNTKMTYEKLSRAMRTYYDKQILVPVPKTGLYPKKLVYKFGPGAQGWCKSTAVMA